MSVKDDSYDGSKRIKESYNNGGPNKGLLGGNLAGNRVDRAAAKWLNYHNKQDIHNTGSPPLIKRRK